jgi:hypothetical protein
LRDAAVLGIVFLEAGDFSFLEAAGFSFLEAGDFFAAGRPGLRARIWRRLSSMI